MHISRKLSLCLYSVVVVLSLIRSCEAVKNTNANNNLNNMLYTNTILIITLREPRY